MKPKIEYKLLKAVDITEKKCSICGGEFTDPSYDHIEEEYFHVECIIDAAYKLHKIQELHQLNSDILWEKGSNLGAVRSNEENKNKIPKTKYFCV